MCVAGWHVASPTTVHENLCAHLVTLSSYNCQREKSCRGGKGGGSRLLIELLQQHRGDQLRFIGTTWQAPRVWSGGGVAVRLPTADCGLHSDCAVVAQAQALRDVSKQLMFYLIYTASRQS